MSDPSVSIIMRSFNEAWALRETLPALAAQNYKKWELIAIDSGSTDGSVELFHQFPPLHLVQIPHQEYNPARVMNRGMELATSNLAIFLNADATAGAGLAWPARDRAARSTSCRCFRAANSAPRLPGGIRS